MIGVKKRCRKDVVKVKEIANEGTDGYGGLGEVIVMSQTSNKGLEKRLIIVNIKI